LAAAVVASRAAAGSNPYASSLGYATWMLFLVWEWLALRETRILYAVAPHHAPNSRMCPSTPGTRCSSSSPRPPCTRTVRPWSGSV
jgi:hypothetical protein